MIKRSITILWTIFFTYFVILTSISPVSGASLQEILDKANSEFEEFNKNLFTYSIYGGKALNVDLATNGISVAGSEKKPIFVYGSALEASKELGINPPYRDGPNGRMYRALGFTIYNKPFPHPDFPPDYERVPDRITTWYTVSELLEDSPASNRYAISRWIGDPNVRNNRFNDYLADNAFDPDNIKGLHIELEYRARLSPDDADYLDLSDIGYILQPPTEDSWGLVIFFHYDQIEDKLLYSAAVMQPFSLYEEKDLSEDIEQKEDGDSFTLDYNILERNICFDLGESQAQFSPSSRNWTSNATGKLNVYNNSPRIFKDFEVTNNPDVNEWSSTISRDPVIHTLIRRQDFVTPSGKVDNPLEGQYGETTSQIGRVYSDGRVSRTYVTYCNRPNCNGHYRTAGASFDRVSLEQNIAVKVYNGLEKIKPPIFKNIIDPNNTSSFRKELYWTSSPIDINVVRLMYYQNEDDSLHDETAVNGQYIRSFTEQNTADLKWTAPVRSMREEYSADREKARKRDYKVSGNARAAFASDKIYNGYNSIDYPIRSGYYFDPAGTYKFTVTTEIYKDNPNKTKEHEDLVEAIINAFRYESNIVYISASKDAVTIAGDPVSKAGAATYAQEKAVISVKKHPFFDIDVDKDYDTDAMKAEELLHDYTEKGTDDRFKPILEGFEESATRDSTKDFIYTEFVRNDMHVYKITETSTVTITVNPENKKLYTHAQLKNGEYYVRAYMDNVDLSKITEKRLDTLNGVDVLDNIRVNVVGSMYDDVH